MQVSDGIVAPGYDAAALAILKAKKGGKFIVLEANPDFKAPSLGEEEFDQYDHTNMSC